MRIGLDFHGVIAAGTALKSAVLREKYGIAVPPEFCRGAYLINEGYVTREKYEELLKHVYEDSATHARMHPIPGAIEAIRLMLAGRHTVRVITASDEAAGRNVTPWLRAHGLDLPVICVGRDGDKTSACEGLNLYVDDDLAQLLNIKRKGLKKFLFGPQLQARPKVWLANRIRRVLTWTQFVDQHLRYARVA